MQKKLLSGLFWVLLLNLLIKPFWILGIEVGVQNAVGDEAYGFYFVIFNLAYIFNILLDIGITNFNTRNIAQHPRLIDKHLGSILCIKLLLLALYAAVTFTVGLLLGYSSRQFFLLAFLSLNQFLNSLILYLRSNFEGLLLFKWDSVISILDRVIMIAICSALLWLPGHPEFKIEYFVYAQTAAYLLTALTALAVLLRKTRFRRLRFNRPFTLVVLKKSAPFALLVLLMASYNRIDPLLLEHLLPDGACQAGVYARAFRLLDALTMIAYLVSVPLLPIYSKLVLSADKARENSKELGEITRLVTSLMLVFSITAAVVCATHARELMDLLYKECAEPYADAFRILIYGIIPISMTYVFGTLLTANGQLKQLNILASITLVINIFVNIICIPRWGVTGAAWASLTAQSFMAVAQIWVALKKFSFHLSIFYIIKIILFALLVIVFSALIPIPTWQGQILIALTGALVAAFALRLIDIKAIVNIVKTKE